MAGQVNANYSANFQKFVDFANKAYATKSEDTVARFSGMPKGDYKGGLSWGAREVGSPCEWRGGARHCSRAMVGESGLETC